MKLEKEKEEQYGKQILVIGSSNTDMVIKARHLPRPGETILGGTFLMNPGGKGANQAVAVARLGGQVSFICKTGNDIFGHQSQQLFEEEGIDTTFLRTVWIFLIFPLRSGAILQENCFWIRGTVC